MNLKPLFDRVIVQKIHQPDTKTKNGIILPTSVAEQPILAKVLSVGEGKFVDGKREPMQVKPNDQILFHEFCGSEFVSDGESVIILRQGDILAILSK